MRRKLGTPADSGKFGWIGLTACVIVFAPIAPGPKGLSSAGGWSGDGHRIVCQLAWNRLTPDAKSGVQRLLGSDLTGLDFAGECVWADEIRAQLSAGPEGLERFRPFTTAHYVNFEPEADRLSPEGCSSTAGPRARYCALNGITHLVDVLGGASSALSRAEALRFLIHFVGDIHQPLHAGYGHDRGGNDHVVNVMG
ncbi:MAG: S1/P1 nuclease, partial [Longimicrobiales bacterium]